ncbi:Hsp70 family protein [Didymella exigua CBS 183.55]|uniref:Hsp70 family protein n=1 Tax=Didymella exigua CBS 183.55 TaxID=1150837 RepID=A0A6A5RNS9_9PLEO|nr:Hsp70 family protein [Didymella exigua CBS 183.55]KAF1930071.1 Hsp70 family protein [Didymella exigua CBS 183.55]
MSYCETSDTGVLDKHIEVIKDWPSRHTKIGTKEQVSSEIAYLPDGTQWGSLIPINFQSHMWTKLELDSPQTGEAARIQREPNANTGSTRKPVDIVADFLEQFPKLKRIITIAESEAAAVYTIQSLRGSAQDAQSILGDGFVACDMGGGTVDLISYSAAGLEPTILEESTVGSGDQCGGSFVDRGFLKWLEQRLGTEDFVKIAGCRSHETPRTSMSKKLGQMVQDFILEAKSGFSGTDTNYLRLPAPLSAIDDDEPWGISDGEIKIAAEDMQEMFEFPIRRTYDLILGQIQQTRLGGKVQPKYIIMVGGFSGSHVWSAIVRGAAAKGLEGDGRKPIKNRKCRRNYGTECMKPFDSKEHRDIDAYTCQYTGKKMAAEQMLWGLKKGQDLSTSETCHTTSRFENTFWVGDKRYFSIDLLTSDAEKSANRTSEKSVNKLATLEVNLSTVPEKEFVLMHSPSGVPYYRLKLDLEIYVDSTIEYSFTVNGKKYGTIHAKYH